MRLQNQLEGLLNEGRIKLSSVVTDPLRSADNRLRVSREDLAELRGSLTRILRLPGTGPDAGGKNGTVLRQPLSGSISKAGSPSGR